MLITGAAGADTSEKSRIMFSGVKGKAENLLNAISFPKKYIFRPGHIQPPGIAYRITLPLISLFFKLIPSMGTTDKYIGKAMVKIGMQDQIPSRIFENSDIRRISV